MPEFARRPVGTKLQAGATFAAGMQPAELGNGDNLALRRAGCTGLGTILVQGKMVRASW
jgi:hypothetical protein